MRTARFLSAVFFAGISATACATQKTDGGPFDEFEPSDTEQSSSSSSSTGAGAGGTGDSPEVSSGDTPPEDSGLDLDVDTDIGPEINPDTACAAVAAVAETKLLPVDIIWVVDNSASMAPAIEQVKAGLNAFAELIGQKSLDYRVIMLSLRSKTSPVKVGGSTRYPVCIAPPLAGDDNCSDGTRFFQSSVDIRSTQPLEQLLGTLGQTEGYLPGQEKGGDPWAAHLRPEATKTIVVVTDDNARLSVSDFETFPGGKNPFNSLTLPPGILDPSWKGLFNGYLFSGIYGWGSDADPAVTCEFPDQSAPSSSGPTYTQLVKKTGGVRAKICDGQAAWQPFFDAVAQAVLETSKLSCNLVIPTPSSGTIDYGKVNVVISGESSNIALANVGDASKCGVNGGWYYNDPANPTDVILCPSSCTEAQASVGLGKQGHIDVLFGCETIVN